MEPRAAVGHLASAVGPLAEGEGHSAYHAGCGTCEAPSTSCATYGECRMAIASIIWAYVKHDVEFSVVGGMAAVLQGAPVHIIDLDIVYALADANISRLELALTELDAVFRDDPRQIVPNRSHLQSRASTQPTKANQRWLFAA